MKCAINAYLKLPRTIIKIVLFQLNPNLIFIRLSKTEIDIENSEENM